MKTVEIGAFEAKTHFSRLLDQVESGQTIIITRRGKRVAKLEPSTLDEIELKHRRELARRLEALRNRSRPGGESMKELVDQGRKQ